MYFGWRDQPTVAFSHYSGALTGATEDDIGTPDNATFIATVTTGKLKIFNRGGKSGGT